MEEFLSSTPAQLVIWLTGLAILTAIGFFLVQKYRDRIDEDQPGTNDLLTKFGELHDEGDIDEKEYRKIKLVLGSKLQQELNDDGEEG